MAPRLVIRADGHSVIGAGHLLRCLALAQVWRAEGGAVSFASHCDSAGLLARLGEVSDEVVRLESPADRGHLELAARHPGVPVVLDGYQFDELDHRAVLAAGHRLLVLDDHVHLATYQADWILNQNLGISAERYPGVAARLLLGPSYALLRREFTPNERTTPASARRLLVTLGGSDPDNVTLEVLRGVAAASEPDWTVRVIAGHSNPNVPSLRALAQTARFSCELLQAVDDMPAQMRWADLAVSAAGSTIWELAFMQLPALLITVADNQGDNARELDARGVALDLGRPDAGLAGRVEAGLRALAGDEQRRAEMARQGRQLVDGAGAGRVVAVLREERA